MPEPKDGSELKGKTGITRLVNAFRYSCKGFASGWKTEEAIREEFILAVIMIPVACILPITLVEKLLLISVVVLVLIVEVLNSAIEAVVDRFGGEIHELSGKAKDLGSLAVLVSLFLCGGVWFAIIINIFIN